MELAIQKPEYLEHCTEDRFNVWIKTTDKFLRVTFKEEEGGPLELVRK